MATELVRLETDGSTAVVTMNRPEKRNALSPELVADLTDVFKQIGSAESVRGVILTGAGPVFCAGLDLGRINTTPVEGKADLMSAEAAEGLMALFETIAHLPKPTIAAVNGHAVAGGAGLMTTCDLVVASRDARIGYPEVKRGLVAVIVMTYLHRQIADRHARRLLLTGDLIAADQAAGIGLVNWVVEPDNVLARAREIAGRLIECGPQSLALTKRLLADLHTLPPDQCRAWAVKWNAQMRRQAEALEGIAAYREKRKPGWAQ